MKETNYFTREKARISKVLENKYEKVWKTSLHSNQNINRKKILPYLLVSPYLVHFLLFVSLKKLRLLCKKILRNNCQVADRNVPQMYNSVLLFLKYVLDSADLSKQKTIICAATDNKFN